MPGAEDERCYAPRLERVTDADNYVVTVEKDDIDWEAHEEHVHPHERLEPAAHEEHPVTGLQAVASKQAARLPVEAASVLDKLAQRGAAGPIDCANDTALHHAIPQQSARWLDFLHDTPRDARSQPQLLAAIAQESIVKIESAPPGGRRGFRVLLEFPRAALSREGVTREDIGVRR